MLAAALLITNGAALAADAAKAGRDGQAFGQSLADKFQFPTEGSGGSVNLGNGESIKPGDMAPKGEGFYVSEPNVGGLQGIYDSDEAMHDVGRGTQNQLWQDAQLKGNPFDPDPAMRDQPGPSTVSGAVYQIITGVSDARAQVPDLTNDPIVNGAGDHMTNPDLLDSFGDCSLVTDVTESTRPVHLPDLEYCERVTAPAPSNCQVKHEVIIERKTVKSTGSASRSGNARCNGSGYAQYMSGTTLQPGDTYSGFQAANVAIPGTEDACKGGALKYTVKSVQYINTGFTDIANYCEVISGFSGGTNQYFYPTLSSVSCKNGLITLSLRSSMSVGLNKISLSYEATAEEVFVKEDKWYPEECVKAAQKTSG